uniref:TonB-dependent receptor n=1 Tax=Macrostomum lignano TaxID=282301 RepID=A0A1I8IZW4_9PLAT
STEASTEERTTAGPEATTETAPPPTESSSTTGFISSTGLPEATTEHGLSVRLRRFGNVNFHRTMDPERAPPALESQAASAVNFRRVRALSEFFQPSLNYGTFADGASGHDVIDVNV